MRNLIVIGASAGGIKAISKVIQGISETIDAAILIVLHVSHKSSAHNISEIFQRSTALECLVASDGVEIERGKIYLAPPEHHLIVSDHLLHLTKGPEENKYRPSIDVLFRSAAVNFSNKIIGIILTGMLDDGTSGMYAVKSCGGLCIVQDPSEAEYSDMPSSVLRNINVNYMSHLDEIPFIIEDILSKPLPPEVAIPEELKIEAEITEKVMSDIDKLKKIANRSDFVCPDCGGGLWGVKNDPMHRYRCHTGHVYSENTLNELLDIKIEESVWVSIRMLEEKHNMLRLLAERRNENIDNQSNGSLSKRIVEITEHIKRLKLLLKKLHNEEDV